MPLATETVTIGSCSHQKLPLKGQLALSHSIQLHGEHTGAPPALEVGVAECETEGLEAQHFAKKNWLPGQTLQIENASVILVPIKEFHGSSQLWMSEAHFAVWLFGHLSFSPQG